MWRGLPKFGLSSGAVEQVPFLLTMDVSVAIDQDEALVAELHRLGVRHLARLTPIEYPDPLTPGTLIAGLAASEDARLQAALILLFLQYPTYSRYLSTTLSQLSDPSANALKLYYQAAVYLQTELAPVLRMGVEDWQTLPDYFSVELDLLPVGALSLNDALKALGERHHQLSGWACNWSGSYQQNIPRFLKHLQHANGHQSL